MSLTEIEVEFLWIPNDLGGHRSVPYVGMRPTIRWQKHLRDHLERARDGECTSVNFNETTGRGAATLRLISEDAIPIDWLHEGSLVELLDGYRVIAVGRIVVAPAISGSPGERP